MITHLAAIALSLTAAQQVTTPAALQAHVKYLSSDALQGRLTGSAGERAAGDYARNWFVKHGLKPIGEKGTYFQEFPASEGLKAGPNARLSVQAGKKNTVAVTGTDYNPLPYSRDKLTSGQAVFVNYGIANDAENDYGNQSIKGKIVIALATDKQRFREIAAMAKSKGAQGIVFVSAGSPARVSWKNSIAKDADIAAAVISAKFFERIFGMKYAVAKQLADKGFFTGNRSETINMRNEVVGNDSPGRNVMAMLPGNDPQLKNEYVVFGAHIDHVGWGDFGSLSGVEAIHNGADDNASGSALVLELAKYFSQKKTNRRTLVFQLYSGEELGLVGSSYFIKHPTFELDKVTAMFNFDMVGNLTDNKLILDGKRSSTIWDELIPKYAGDYSLDLDPAGAEALGGRSDHGPWENAGVPVIFFYTGEHARYHRHTDKWNLLNYAGMAKIAETAVKMITDVDLRPTMLPFRSGTTITERGQKQPPTTGGGMGGPRKIRVGLMPDYTDPGPGLLLKDVSPDSPAEKGGLRGGDRIVKWGTIPIDTIEDIQLIFESSKPGVAVKVVVVRDGKQVELTIVPEPPLVSKTAEKMLTLVQ